MTVQGSARREVWPAETPWTVDRESLAWAAGFFDGEGSACRAVGRYPKVTIGQNDPTLLERFRRIVGVGNGVYGPYGPYTSRTRSPRYHYKVTNRWEVQHIACVLWPWLSTAKKNQFRSALRT